MKKRDVDGVPITKKSCSVSAEKKGSKQEKEVDRKRERSPWRTSLLKKTPAMRAVLVLGVVFASLYFLQLTYAQTARCDVNGKIRVREVRRDHHTRGIFATHDMFSSNLDYHRSAGEEICLA